MPKQYRYDYHSEYGWNRAWVEAENEFEAEQKAREDCRVCRRSFDEGSLKECESQTAANDYINALFEKHAMSFAKEFGDD